ncbi:hypothetical protein DC28_03245 [Spirochaeta lutea]|uniref:J domain-containing protein n=2 Tax=Spirochaeta lutea TaxID=1480694 RepID=A0A098R128_9SPIO|nr:hypothetical protein DC28_03245 [Spirochaeta lutea]
MYGQYAARQIRGVLGWKGRDPGSVYDDELILLALGVGAVFLDGPPKVAQIQVLQGYIGQVVALRPSEIPLLRQLSDDMIRLQGPRAPQAQVLCSLALAHGRWLASSREAMAQNHSGLSRHRLSGPRPRVLGLPRTDRSPENLAIWLYHLAGSEREGMTRSKLEVLLGICRCLGVQEQAMLARFRQGPHLSGDALERLGLPEDSGAEQIKQRYRRLQRDLHPDRRNGVPGQGYQEVQDAYQILRWQLELPEESADPALQKSGISR